MMRTAHAQQPASVFLPTRALDLPTAGKIRRFGARRIYKLKDFKKVYVTIAEDSFDAAPKEDIYRPKLSEAGEEVMAEVEKKRREAAQYESQHGDGRV